VKVLKIVRRKGEREKDEGLKYSFLLRQRCREGSRINL
jgi:hypothetical protein